MKKGFTLVELLGAIILLGLISLLIAVPIIARINKASGKISKATERILKEHVMQYISENSNDFRSTKEGTKYYITLDELEFNRDGFDVKVNGKTLDPNTQLLIEINENGDYEVSVLTDNEELSSIKSSYADGAYVIFNGFMWRMISEDDNNKTIRLLCDEFVGSIQNGTSTSYKETYTYRWLNNDFASKLNYLNVLKETDKGLISIPTKQENTLYPISNYVYSVLDGNNITTNNNSNNTSPLIRPVIDVYEGTVITSGTGESTDPFILREYKNDQSELSFKEADISIGEYVSFDNKKYRIIEYGSEMVKLISTFSEGPSSYANTNETFNLNNGAGSVLNGSNVSNYMVMNNVFAGALYKENANYENTTLKKSNAIYGVYKALPRIGEILAVPINNSSYWTMSMYDSSKAYLVGTSGLSKANYSGSYNLIYTTYISADNTIVDGNGTKDDPYTIGQTVQQE